MSVSICNKPLTHNSLSMKVGQVQIGNESKAWTVAPDGKVYDGLLVGGGEHPHRATGMDTGWTTALITEA
jgi:hypothetical protein